MFNDDFSMVPEFIPEPKPELTRAEKFANQCDVGLWESVEEIEEIHGKFPEAERKMLQARIDFAQS